MGTGGTSTHAAASSLDAALTFRVLGPFEVWAGASRLDVGGPKERALLALLLTAPGRVLSVPTIVAGLWGDQPPGGAEKTVMSYVSRLRHGLPDGAAHTVVTRRPGYLASVGREQVDAERFRSLVADGHRQLAAEPELAAATLREALELWQGDAYAEFDAPFAVAERGALEELRLAALEDRIAADLETGAGPELVGELEALVTDLPLRERLWVQLMTALYRSGRQADALRSYQRARSWLVEELGVEPSSELQAVHSRVLVHDQRLLGPTAPAAGQSPARAVAPTFVGRAHELSELREAYRRAVAGGAVRVLVSGPSGIGKTRLLAELARHVQASGGTVTDLPSRVDVADAATPVLLLLDDVQRRSAAELRTLSDLLLLRRSRMLVAAAGTLDDLAAEQVDRLADLLPERLTLAPLSPADVAALVELYVPQPDLADATASDDVRGAAGVPRQVHAAAGRFAEALVGARIGAAALTISDPRRRLARSRDRVAEGVAELQRLGSLRRAHVDAAGPLHVCPYKGLAFYDVDDAPYFAGRERLVARLVARLVDAPLLAVVGASGSGKSSVVRAGLLAAISTGLLPGSERWHVLLTTPGRPAPVVVPADGSRPRTLLVVDQLEELVTVLPPPAQQSYAAWLTATAERPDVTVVVAVRSDYVARVAVHRQLAELIAANTVLVGPMSAEELRRAVEVPAATADLLVEPGLAREIAGDVVGEPGGLPLMSTALLSLWERGDGRRLSLTDYRETGGIRTAVQRLAETAFAQLTDPQQSSARRILLRLAEVDDAGEPVRRRVLLTELSVDTDPDARTALDLLAARRLLTVSTTHVEVAHEALLREWPRLRGWLDDDEAGRRLRRHLAPAAAAWKSAGEDPGELYRGQRLMAALDFRGDHGDDLTDVEHDFLRASQVAADADAHARRRSIRRLRVLATGLAAVVVLALSAGWVAVDRRNESLRLAVQAEMRALSATALREDRWDLALLYAAQAYQLDGSAQATAGLLRTVHRSPDATAMYLTDGRLLAVAISADGTTLAGLGSAGTVDVWDVATGERTRTVSNLTESEVTSFDLSPDGRYLAVVGVPVDQPPTARRPQLMLTDLDATPPRTERVPGPRVNAARFLDDGRTIATIGEDGAVRTLDIGTGRLDLVLGLRVAVSDAIALDVPVGRRFMVAADFAAAGPVTVWEASTDRVVWSAHEGAGTVASVSPDGTALLLAYAGGRVELVDLGTGGGRRPVPFDFVGEIVDLDWAPDRSSFAGATTEGTVVVWDATTLELRSVLRGHAGRVSQVVYSPDGRSVYASGFDGTVVAWDLTGARGVVRRIATPRPARALGPFAETTRALAADGSLAVAFRDEGVLELIDVPAGTSTSVTVPLPGRPARVVVDPTGRHAGLLTVHYPGSLDAEMHVVDVASGALLPRIGLVADFLTPAPAFSRNGRSLVTVDVSSVLVWDVQTGRPAAGRARYDAREEVVSVAPDATGRVVAVGVWGGGLEVGDTVTGELVAELDLPGGENLAVRPLIFSPDGRWLAGGSESGRVVVWDTSTWEAETWMAVPGGGVDSLAFTADSRAVVAAGAGTASIRPVDREAAAIMTMDLSAVASGSDVAVASLDEGRTVVTFTEGEGVQLWDISPQALLEQACEVAGRNLSAEEWSAVLPTVPFARTCPAA
ncbi:BTAD domain-containing putative transcriptional regulator [Cellulomonas sp.]|uniref:nSTAND1 domain-containing NTPase n=1 Tax=Cellulomonas sp. TaxID=40001 RepID=UPI003BA93ACB